MLSDNFISSFGAVIRRRGEADSRIVDLKLLATESSSGGGLKRIVGGNIVTAF